MENQDKEAESAAAGADQDKQTLLMDQELDKIVDSIRQKAQLLICMQPPPYFKQSDDHEQDPNFFKKPSYLKHKSSV